MENKAILLVEDNADDEALTLRALKKNNIRNEVIVAHDGAEALEYLFGMGKCAGRNTDFIPQGSPLGPEAPEGGRFGSHAAAACRSTDKAPPGGHSNVLD